MSAGVTKRTPGLLSRWTETDPFLSVREEMENLFSRFAGNGKGLMLTPSLDLTEVNGSYQIRMDVPGMKAEEINIDVNGDVVTISGERKEEKEEKGEKYHRVERHFGSFSRTVRLPFAVREDKIDAQLKDGVLTLKLPKTEEAKAHRVKIKAS